MFCGYFRHTVVGCAQQPLRDAVRATFSSFEALEHTTINKLETSTIIVVTGVTGMAWWLAHPWLAMVNIFSNFSFFAFRTTLQTQKPAQSRYQENSMSVQTVTIVWKLTFLNIWIFQFIDTEEWFAVEALQKFLKELEVVDFDSIHVSRILRYIRQLHSQYNRLNPNSSTLLIFVCCNASNEEKVARTASRRGCWAHPTTVCRK